jgi:hypothetical protein
VNIVVYKTEEEICIVTPAEGVSLDQVIALTIPASSKYNIIDDSALPDGYFRDAWEIDDNMHVSINILKAKQIQKDCWRVARNKKLKELDYKFMLALEQDNSEKINNIKTLKAALRDVTKIDLPDNIIDIKNTWPKILNEA